MTIKDKAQETVNGVVENVKQDVEAAKKIKVDPKKIILGVASAAGIAIAGVVIYKYRSVASMAAAAAADVVPEAAEVVTEAVPEVVEAVL